MPAKLDLRELVVKRTSTTVPPIHVRMDLRASTRSTTTRATAQVAPYGRAKTATLTRFATVKLAAAKVRAPMASVQFAFKNPVEIDCIYDILDHPVVFCFFRSSVCVCVMLLQFIRIFIEVVLLPSEFTHEAR